MSGFRGASALLLTERVPTSLRTKDELFLGKDVHPRGPDLTMHPHPENAPIRSAPVSPMEQARADVLGVMQEAGMTRYRAPGGLRLDFPWRMRAPQADSSHSQTRVRLVTAAVRRSMLGLGSDRGVRERPARVGEAASALHMDPSAKEADGCEASRV